MRTRDFSKLVSDINLHVWNSYGVFALFDIYAKPFQTNVTSTLACDFNQNNRIDIGGVVLCLEALIGKCVQTVHCDLDHNGELDIGDCIIMLRMSTTR